MTNFEKAFAKLIGNEGGFKKEATDRMDWTSGKCGVGTLKGTKYGLSAGTYPDLDIENLTLANAYHIYKTVWWDRFRGDQFPYRLAYQVFDAEVNHGPGMGVKFLQQALGLTVDKKIGPITLQAVAKAEEFPLIMKFLSVRLNFYTKCETWKYTYGKGWSARIANNLLIATEE